MDNVALHAADNVAAEGKQLTVWNFNSLYTRVTRFYTIVTCGELVTPAPVEGGLPAVAATLLDVEGRRVGDGLTTVVVVVVVGVRVGAPAAVLVDAAQMAVRSTGFVVFNRAFISVIFTLCTASTAMPSTAAK